MASNLRRALVPRLRTPDQPRIDLLFGVSAISIPEALARTRNQFDGFTCNHCGFTSGKYQMTSQCGPSHRTLRDLATTCRPCWQVMNLEAAITARSAKLIWLPELSQTDLNRYMPELYAARIAQGTPAALAKNVLSILMARCDKLKEHGEVADLKEMVGLLRTAEHKRDQAANDRVLAPFDDGLRLLPLDRWIVREKNLEFNLYPQMLAYFRSRNGPADVSGKRFALLAQDWLSLLGERIEVLHSA